jgi:sterol desaturase/sphingolipid hydroxylase (fatty acid hydroxylase superfamily)
MIEKVLGSWILYNSCEYFLHLAAHCRIWWNPLYRLHIIHHHLYPFTDLQSENIRGCWEGVIGFAPPFLIIMTPFYYLEEYEMMAMISSLLLISDYIHSQIHLKDSWLDSYEWFKKRRERHFIHHRQFDKNLSFGGLSYQMDKFMGSYKPCVLDFQRYRVTTDN